MKRYEFAMTIYDRSAGPAPMNREDFRCHQTAESEHEARRKAILQAFGNGTFVRSIKLLKVRSNP